MILRLIFTFYLIVFPYKFLMANQVMNTAIKVLEECYDKTNDLRNYAPCVKTEREKIHSLQNLQIRIKFKNPEKNSKEKVPILMVDKTGYMYYCIATAGKNLTIDSCAGTQGKPLSEGQLMSIELLRD
ncbi:hypothetical protein [Legionella sainthelensi]|uniref:hypothetical protein n=1 Tax=Legionella sainthelensi TaxID=28087 RepID=UPI000E200580|nr:hypothetical protein [Legionella sainthelensi]